MTGLRGRVALAESPFRVLSEPGGGTAPDPTALPCGELGRIVGAHSPSEDTGILALACFLQLL